MKWVQVKDEFVSGGGQHPQQWFASDGSQIFVVAYVREGGGSDTKGPRRVLGVGKSRIAAHRDAIRAQKHAERTLAEHARR